MNLKSEIDLFFSEFSEVESHGVGQALRSMSSDRAFVEQSERLLDHDARFTLLKRMASVRRVPPAILSEIEEADARAAELREKRDELARTMWSINNETDCVGETTGQHRRRRRLGADVWIPTVAEIEKCRTSTAKLQATLEAITQQVADP